MRTVLKQYASPKQTERMERIVASVKRQLIEGGLESINIRDLARESKVSIATLYNRFGDKDKLIATAVIDHVRDVILAPAARFSSQKPLLDRIVHLIGVMNQEIARTPAFVMALMSSYFKLNNDREMPENLYRPLYLTLCRIVEEMQETGQVQPHIPVALYCEEMVDHVFVLIMKWAQGEIPLGHLNDRMVFSVLTVLSAIASDDLGKVIKKTSAPAIMRLSARN